MKTFWLYWQGNPVGCVRASNAVEAKKKAIQQSINFPTINPLYPAYTPSLIQSIISRAEVRG